MWREKAALEGRVAEFKSEQRHTAASPTSWVFNWRAEGWGPGHFESKTHDFGGGATGKFMIQRDSIDGHAKSRHFIGFRLEGLAKCRLHYTVCVLDKHDKTLRQVHKLGTATAPIEKDFTVSRYWGRNFTPTAEEKAQSVRADGSIRLRAVVTLFL